MAKTWTLMSDDDQSKKLVDLILQGIHDETQKHAEYVVNELHDAITKINDIQQEFLDGKYPNSVNWLATQLEGIAEKHQLDSDELYGTVLSSLFKSNREALKSLAQSNAPMDEHDWRVLPPENAFQRDEALKEIDWLHESLAKCHLGQVLESFQNQKERKDDTSNSYYRILVEKALKSQFLSKEELALKLEIAVRAYVELRNNPDYQGLAMADAIKQAMIFVTNLKYGYKKQQRGQLVAKLKKYVKSAYLATTKVLLEKVWPWRDKLVGIGFDLIARERVLSEVEQWLNGLNWYVEIESLLSMAAGRLICGTTVAWLYKNLEPNVILAIKDLKNEVLPSLYEAAKDSLEKVNKDILSVGGKIRRAGMNLCESLTSALKDWSSEESEEETVSENSEAEEESEDEEQSEDEEN